MNLLDYQRETQRTCPDLGNEKLNIAHMIMGMVSEITELNEAINKNDIINIGEEISDVMWYLSNYCTYYNISLEKLSILSKKYVFIGDGNDKFKELTLDISKLTDIEKKYIAYNKEVNPERRIDFVTNAFFTISQLYKHFILDMQKCLENNINKLKVRFPEKFTEENAIDRDLEKERIALEA